MLSGILKKKNNLKKVKMKKIKNPYANYENFNCFCCSPNNPIGLRMEFFEDGDQIISYWQPKDYFQGYKNVLHGGIQTTLMDEIASWTVNIKAKTAGITSRIDVRFKKPVYINAEKITIKATLKELSRKMAVIHTQLFNPDDQLCSEAIVTYYIFPPDIAKQKLGFPGYEEFF